MYSVLSPTLLSHSHTTLAVNSGPLSRADVARYSLVNSSMMVSRRTPCRHEALR